MVYELVLKLFKKHVYSIYFEKFKNELEDHFIERYVGKHALLKPNLIVVNDQLHGFKKVSEHIRSLEKFPIYLEVEYLADGDVTYLESIDLYSEVQHKCSERFDDVAKLAKRYEKTVNLERVTRLADSDTESMIVYSRIADAFSKGYLEMEIEDGAITGTEVELMLESYIVSFVQFIQQLDEILVKGKPFPAPDSTYSS